MKFFVAIAAFVAVIALANAGLTEEQKDKLKAYKAECVTKSGVDVAVIEKAKNGEFTKDDKFGAFLLCFGEKVDFIKADGTYNTAVIKEKLSKKTGTDVSAIVDKCVEHDEKDAAKNALHLAECLKTNLPKHEGVF